MRVAWFSHPGRRKVCNDDAVLIGADIYTLQNSQTPVQQSCEMPLLCAVADGMGSLSEGERASKVALETFRDSVLELRSRAGAQQVVQQITKKIDVIAQKRRLRRGLGTTVAGVLIERQRAIIFNCGDSRVYLAAAGRSMQISMDHTEVAQKVAAGLLTKEEARRHARKSIMTQALVGGLHIEVPEIFWQEFDFTTGGRIALMTDGVWESMPEDVICRSLSTLPGEFFLREMLNKAFQDGARDNVTCIVVEA